MGCVCCSLSSFVSIVLDALERVSLCTVCAMLTCCLMITILTVMVLGIGIGYHYCFVQNSVDAMAKAAESAGALRSGPPRPHEGHVMRSVDKAVKRGFAHRISKRGIDNPPHINNTTYYNTTFMNITNDYPIIKTFMNITNDYPIIKTFMNITNDYPIIKTFMNITNDYPIIKTFMNITNDYPIIKTFMNITNDFPIIKVT